MAGTGKAHLRDQGDILLRVEDLVVECPVGRTGMKVNAVSVREVGACLNCQVFPLSFERPITPRSPTTTRFDPACVMSSKVVLAA